MTEKEEPSQPGVEKSDLTGKKSKRIIHLVMLVLILLIVSSIIIGYIAAVSSSDPYATYRGVCIIISLILGVILFELLMKPQIALVNPRGYCYEKDETESDNDETDEEKT